MYIALLQVIFAAIRTICRSALNVLLYSFVSQMLNKWFGFSTLISFFGSAYCISKLEGYVKRLLLKRRLQNKKPEEQIFLNELSWISSISKENQFENDWKLLLDNDTKSMFPLIVDIPFHNGWLFFTSMMLIEYQMNSFGYSYITSLIRVLICLIILISGSAIRYQTLFEREKNECMKLLNEKSIEYERYILYSKNVIPIASICVQIISTTEYPVFIIQLYQLNSKYEDYFYDIVNSISQQLIERIKIYGNGKEKSVRLVWSIPTCKRYWTFAIKANKFALRNTYKDFSFMPLVNSYVEQYEYFYDYKNRSEICDETKKDQ